MRSQQRPIYIYYRIFPRDRKVEGNINPGISGRGKYPMYLLGMPLCHRSEKNSRKTWGRSRQVDISPQDYARTP